jgi:hemoglobin
MIEHIPIIVDFWDSVLFQSDTYRKNAMQPHMALHQKSPLQKHHFQTWLKHFNATVDELFDGQKAFEAKQRAQSIATMIELKTSRS